MKRWIGTHGWFEMERVYVQKEKSTEMERFGRTDANLVGRLVVDVDLIQLLPRDHGRHPISLLQHDSTLVRWTNAAIATTRLQLESQVLVHNWGALIRGHTTQPPNCILNCTCFPGLFIIIIIIRR